MALLHPTDRRFLCASALLLAAAGAYPAVAQSTNVNGKSEQAPRADDLRHQPTNIMSGRCAGASSGMMSGVTSDPEEGGQVSARKTHMSDMHVSKHMDKASAKMMDHSSGRGC